MREKEGQFAKGVVYRDGKMLPPPTPILTLARDRRARVGQGADVRACARQVAKRAREREGSQCVKSPVGDGCQPDTQAPGFEEYIALSKPNCCTETVGPRG